MSDRQITDSAPLPLARAFRRYWNAAGARERHDASYFLFEVYLKYAAAVAVARYAGGGPRDHRVNAALKGLVRPSLGEWLRFLRETLRFLTEATGEPDPVAQAMADLLSTRASRWESVLRLYNRLRTFLHGATGEKTQTSLGALLDEIVTYRNRVLGHGAPLDESHYREFASLFGDAFVEVFRASPFLTMLRLVSFPSIQLEAGSRIECEVIEHVGLQPARRAQPILRQLAQGSAPRKNALYLLDPAESLVLLDPLLIAHRDDVYFLNEAGGAPEYLSYSSGERHCPASAGGALGEFFARIVGYTPDTSHLGRMGEDLTPPAAKAVATGQDGDRRLGDYRVTREVGRGAMGVVFEAYQESLGRRVALKVLPGDFALDPKRLERFRREASATARIHHPSIVPVYEVGESGGTHFYSMEFIDGPSLADLLQGARQEAAKTKPSEGSSIVSGEERARVIEQVALVAEGLEEAHRQGLVHRDVKPSNILVDRPDSAPQGNGAQRGVGRYVLVDFGLVRDEEAGTLTRSGEMVGTLGYMSPEQVSRRPVDRRTDVYSLGATLYEILTLRAPCGGDGKSEHLVQAAILFKEPVPPRKLQPRLSRDLETVVLKAIEKDPDRRYASAGGFAADLRRCLRGEPIEAKPPSTWTRISRRALRNKLRVGLAASVLIAASAIGVLAWSFGDGRAERVARETLLPQIERLVEKEDFLAAHDLARQAEGTIPGDPLLGKLWARLSWSYTITTDPPGANVSYKRYEVLDGEWIHLGKSPLENVRFPRGVYRWRVELGGFETRECGQGRGAESERRLHFDLQRSEGHPPGMVWIGPGELPAYWIDKFEVTNAEFQEFVDRGGYQDRQHWQFPFIQDGRTLAFEDAMAQLRDTTGLPGPSTWEKGRYPQGRENYPVAGLSWFEAAAFARFKGKSLPTTRHWYEAACPFEASLIVRFSNFDGKESAPVGSHQGIGITGVYDMAGNVKEWCYNATDDAGSRRYLLGGAWGEPTYLFTDQNAQSPWDRSLQNGFRCVWHPRGEETIPESTLPPFARLFRRDYRKEKPVSDEEVEFFKRELYSYDRTDLEAKVESVDDTAESWRREKISFVPAYGGERMLAYLFLPKGFQPPYQTVILWPGSNVRVNRPLEGLEAALFTEYLIQSGRALLLPIYEGTYERFIETTSLPGPVAGRDRCIRRTQDLRRSIDYLETRDDIQKDKLAYYGLSWGAGIAPIPLVIEPRVRVAVLVVGGFFDGEPHPAADPFNFAPRVRVPVLMVNGEHDMNFPVEASQKPMFDLLGTPPEHKKHVLYPGGHGLNGLFGREIRAEVLGWLDRYLGPVSR